MTAHSFSLAGLRGEEIDLSAFAGRALLVVNTASLCGFTPQYAGLQEIWTEYGPRGLTVLGVPSPDFGGQEHADPAEVAKVCDARFRITFPVAAPTHVVGKDATPLFRWIGKQAGFVGRPHWNFYKYVIGRDGELVQWFSCITTPGARSVRSAIERALGA